MNDMKKGWDNIVTINEAVEFLCETNEALPQNNFLLLTHSHPDADTLGSATALALALRQLGKNAAVLTGFVPSRYAFLNKDGVFVASSPYKKHLTVSADIASPRLLGEHGEAFDNKIDLAIDHHIENTLSAKRKLVLTERAACGEIIYDLITAMNVAITPDIAEALYAAISSDTGGFKYSAVSAHTHNIAAELLKTGIDFAEINRILFETKSKEQFLLEKIAYSSLEIFADGFIALISFDSKALSDFGIDAIQTDYGGIAQLPRQLEGVEVGIMLRPEIGDKSYKISMRSNRYINVAEICALFGGGGHYHAAGCSIVGELDEVKSVVVREVEKRFEKTRTFDNQ